MSSFRSLRCPCSHPLPLLPAQRIGHFAALCKELNLGDATSICRDCGAVIIAACWDIGGGCPGAVQKFSPRTQSLENGLAPVLELLCERAVRPNRSPGRSTDRNDDTNQSGDGLCPGPASEPRCGRRIRTRLVRHPTVRL